MRVPRSRAALVGGLRSPKGIGTIIGTIIVLAIVATTIEGAMTPLPRPVLGRLDGSGNLIGAQMNAGAVTFTVPAGWTPALGSDDRLATIIAPQFDALRAPVTITFAAPDVTRATDLATYTLKAGGGVVIDQDLLALTVKILESNLSPTAAELKDGHSFSVSRAFAESDITYRPSSSGVNPLPGLRLDWLAATPWARAATPAGTAPSCSTTGGATVVNPDPNLGGVLMPDPSGGSTGALTPLASDRPEAGAMAGTTYANDSWTMSAHVPDGTWTGPYARDLGGYLGRSATSETWVSAEPNMIFSAAVVPGATLQDVINAFSFNTGATVQAVPRGDGRTWALALFDANETLSANRMREAFLFLADGSGVRIAGLAVPVATYAAHGENDMRAFLSSVGMGSRDGSGASAAPSASNVASDSPSPSASPSDAAASSSPGASDAARPSASPSVSTSPVASAAATAVPNPVVTATPSLPPAKIPLAEPDWLCQVQVFALPGTSGFRALGSNGHDERHALVVTLTYPLSLDERSRSEALLAFERIIDTMSPS